jgi:hypothetical protein
MRPIDEVFVEPEVAANNEENALDIVFSMLLQTFCERIAGGRLAMLIKDDEPPSWLEMPKQCFGLDPQDPLGIFIPPTG